MVLTFFHVTSQLFLSFEYREVEGRHVHKYGNLPISAVFIYQCHVILVDTCQLTLASHLKIFKHYFYMQ